MKNPLYVPSSSPTQAAVNEETLNSD